MNVIDINRRPAEGDSAPDSRQQGRWLELLSVATAEYQDLLPPDARCTQKKRSGGWLRRIFRSSQPAQFASLHPLLVSFNAATWLRITAPCKGLPLSLWLQYIDSEGRHQVLIDEIVIESRQVMLAGEARFRVTGYLRDVKICLAGLSDASQFKVDELFAQRKRRTAARS